MKKRLLALLLTPLMLLSMLGMGLPEADRPEETVPAKAEVVEIQEPAAPAEEPAVAAPVPEESGAENTADVLTDGEAAEPAAPGDTAEAEESAPDASPALDGATIVISSASITVTPPEAGSSTVTAPVATVTSSNYQVDSAQWVDASGSALSGTTTFVAGQNYYIKVVLMTTSDNYKFGSNPMTGLGPTVHVTGGTGTVNSHTSSTCTALVTVTATGSATPTAISSASITVTPPTAGETSATPPEAEGSAGVKCTSARWCDASGRSLSDTVTFVEGQTYYISVVVEPAAVGDYFTGNLQCLVGDIINRGQTGYAVTQMMDGSMRTVRYNPIISVTATEAAGESRIRWGSNTYNGDVEYTYTANDGNQYSGTQSGSSVWRCKTGTTATLKAVPKAGYGFVGWFSANYDVSGGAFTPSGSALSTDPTMTISVTTASDQTAYCAVFAEVAPVEVALSGTISTFGTTTVNGTPVNTASGEKVNVAVGQPVTIVITPQSGYMVGTPSVPVDPPSDFAYQHNADCSVTTITFTQPAGGARVEAVIAKRIAITYDVNGGEKGSAWPENDLYKYVASGSLMRFTAPAELDASFATPPEGMEYTGYQIGSETVAPGANSSFGVVTSPVTIKLLWEPADVNQPVLCGILSIANGSATMAYVDGVTGQSKQTKVTGNSFANARVAYGTNVTLTAAPDEGYYLEGWYVLDQDDPNDDEGTLVSTDETYVYSATSLTIVMVKFGHIPTVTVNDATHGTVSADKATAAEGETVTLTVTPDAGYKLETLTVTDGSGSPVTVAGNTFTMPAGPVTVTAAFVIIPTYTVSFSPDGGTEVPDQTVAEGSKAAKPADPVKEDFAFDGWYKDAALTEAFDFSAGITADMTLYAKWTEAGYVLTSVTGATADASHTWTKGSGSDVVITVERNDGVDRSFDHFTGVELDGEELVPDTDYTAHEGSTVVTLKAELLEKLDLGEHTVTVRFDNGSVQTRLTVKAPQSGSADGGKNEPSQPGKGGAPRTGDDSSAGLWVAALSLCTVGLGAVLGRKKKKAL